MAPHYALPPPSSCPRGGPFAGLLALQSTPFRITDYLRRGHAIHFRCRHPEALNVRLDVMAVLRGVDPFPLLWERRTTILGQDGEEYQLLSVHDLVQAKKTQRNKDWPMIQRLVEVDYFTGDPTPARLRFWLRELRTPEILISLAAAHPAEVQGLLSERPLLAVAVAGDLAALEAALRQEECRERERDRVYWEPLRRELEGLRRAKRMAPGSSACPP